MGKHAFYTGLDVHSNTARHYTNITDRDNDDPLETPIPPATTVPDFQVAENIDKTVRVNEPTVIWYKLVSVDPTVWTQETTDTALELAAVLVNGNQTGGTDLVVDTGDVITITDAPVAGTDGVNKTYSDTYSFILSNATIGPGVARSFTGETFSSLVVAMADADASTFTERGVSVVGYNEVSIIYQAGDGAGAVTGVRSLSATDTDFTATDSIDSIGIVYAADYSANYTDRSLVDKQYVDESTLAESDQTIATDVHRNVSVDGTSGAVHIHNYNPTEAAYTVRSEIESEGGGLILQVWTGDGAGSDLLGSNITVASTFMSVVDGINNQGLLYGGDYSSNWTSRSLVDKGYVDAQVGANNELSEILANGNTSGGTDIVVSTGDVITLTDAPAAGTDGTNKTYADSISIYLSDYTLDGTVRTVDFINDGQLIIDCHNNTTTNYTERSYLDVSELHASIGAAVGDGLGGDLTTSWIQVSPAFGMLIQDETDLQGLKYVTDYSATFTARSLIDKGYADSLHPSLDVLTDAQEDALSPSEGDTHFNSDRDASRVYDGAKWNYASDSGDVLYVRTLADLPDPVANVITIPNFSQVYVEQAVDLDVNTLSLGNFVRLRNVGAGSLTSSHADQTVLVTGALVTGMDRIPITNTGTNTVAMRITGGGTIFTESNTFTGDIIVEDFARMDFETVNVFGTVQFTTDEPTASVNMAGVTLVPTGANCIEIDNGITLGELYINGGSELRPPSGFFGIHLADPDAVGLGKVVDADFTGGAGEPFGCTPVRDSTITLTSNNARGCCIDNAGNLIVTDITTDNIVRYVGLTDVVDATIAATGTNNQGLTWHRGNLYTIDVSTRNVRKFDGFSTTILQTVQVTESAIDICFVGEDLVTWGTDEKIRVKDGFSDINLSESPSAIVTDAASGIDTDGLNLLLAGNTTGLVYVMEGTSDVILYSFDADSASNWGIATHNGNFVSVSGSTAYIFNKQVDFHHSSPTWNTFDNVGGLANSANRGGAFYTSDTPITITVSAAGTWYDIAGAGIYYGLFAENEKCYLTNEENGEITWTGVRETGQILTGSAIITRAGGGAVDIFYEVAVMINGIVIKDSIGTAVLAINNAVAAITTLPITRAITADDTVCLQIRNTTNTQDPQVSVAKLSIT